MYQSFSMTSPRWSGVGVGQRLVDRLHRSGRQAGGEQAIAQRFGVVLAEHGGEFGAQRLAVGDAVLVAGKTRIGAEFGLADFTCTSLRKVPSLPTPIKMLPVRVGKIA